MIFDVGRLNMKKNKNTDFDINTINDVKSGKYGRAIMFCSKENKNYFTVIIEHNGTYTFIYPHRDKSKSIHIFETIKLVARTRYKFWENEFGIYANADNFNTDLWKIGNLHCDWRDIDSVMIRSFSDSIMNAQQGDAPEPATNAVSASPQSIPPAR